MTASPSHYVPILKLKTAEKAALLEIAPDVMGEIVPLFELVPKDEPAERLTEHVRRSFSGFGKSVRDLQRYFLDPDGIGTTDEAAILEVFKECAMQGGPPFVPIVRLGGKVDAARQFAKRGVALRLTRTDLEGRLRLANAVTQFLRSHRFPIEETDLLVDLGGLEPELGAGIRRMTKQFLAEIPKAESWRTLTLLGNSFPKSMSGVDDDGELLIPREEFLCWSELARERARDKIRVPTFGDGGVQHPEVFTGKAPVTPPAVIRYARRADWVLTKGHSAKDDPFAEQMPQVARRLIASGQFLGADHCAGCRQIAATANDEPNIDNKRPQGWRRIATIHHITTTVRAIQLLLGA